MSKNTNKGGRLGLVGTLIQTLNYLSLEALVSHGQDINYPLRRSVSYFDNFSPLLALVIICMNYINKVFSSISIFN
jgi:hypothetical protein